jgi:uncharacterized protein (TIRG00374 family)
VKRALAIAVSLGLVAVIWWRADPAAVLAALGSVEGGWFAFALLMVVPLTAATALRLCALSRGALGLGEGTRLVLSASSLNLVLPSKMGDLAKAIVLRSRHGMGGSRAVALVVLEKLLDLMALLLVGAMLLWLSAPEVPGLPLWTAGAMATGLLLFAFTLPASPLPRLARALAHRLPAGVGRRLFALLDGWEDLVGWFWANRGLAAAVVAGSLLLWAAHLFQMWLFARAIATDVPMLAAMALAFLAILAGLLPFTFAGIGTRDAALVLLFAPWLTPAEGALLGLFATLRYVLPAAAGLPFIGDYWAGRRAREG